MAKKKDLEFLNRKNLMVDVETIGGVPPQGNCLLPAPFQVSAIAFGFPEGSNSTPQKELATLNETISLGTLPEMFEWELSTLKWHLSQGNTKLISSAFDPETSIGADEVIPLLSDLCNEDTIVWCKGTDFDIPILRTLQIEFEQELPWKYRNVKDMRAFRPFKEPDGFDKHDALDDCRYQIEQLRQKIRDVYVKTY